MDFYKKIVKTKDPPNIVLSAKECKCASLQAITNEAIKENNKKRLKELVEEINGHLTELRAIKDDKEMKNKDKCVELIKKFESCLVKIVNATSHDILEPIKSQLMVIQKHTNEAIASNNIDELKRIAERIERNIMIVNEIPEVKGARNSATGDEKLLDLANRYTALLNDVLSHLSRIGTEPTHKDIENVVQEKGPELKKVPPPDPNKIGINEIEEKLKQMRQRRLNRLSTFVDEQTVLSNERQRENATQGNAEKINSMENVMVPDILRPSLYKAAMRDNHEKKAESKVVTTQLRKSIDFSVENIAVTSSAYSNITSYTYSKPAMPQSKNLPQTSSLNRKPTFENDKNQIKNTFSSMKTDLHEPKKEPTNMFRSSFGKSGLTKSFAERQIENARTQKEKAQPSNTTNITPPRTPTQIRKIFSSFNCALRANNKSVEDLPKECYSPIETEFNRVETKRSEVGSERNLFRYSNNAKKSEILPELKSSKSQEIHVAIENPPAIPDRRVKPVHLKTPSLTNKTANGSTDLKEEGVGWATTTKAADDINESTPSVPPSNVLLKRKAITAKLENESSGDLKAESVQTPAKDNSSLNTPELPPKGLFKSPGKSFTDSDLVMIRHHDGEVTDQDSPEFITIKRKSSTPDQATQRCSFSTFRGSTESVKLDENMAVDNPIYQILDKPKPQCSLLRNNSVMVDEMLMSAVGKEPSDFRFNTLDFIIRKRNRKMSFRNDTTKASRIEALEPDIRKLEFIINIYRGLKRDDDYMMLDKALTKYYLKVNEVSTETSCDTFEKERLLTRLNKAHADLNDRVGKNEDILKHILTEQVVMLAEKYEIICNH